MVQGGTFSRGGFHSGCRSLRQPLMAVIEKPDDQAPSMHAPSTQAPSALSSVPTFSCFVRQGGVNFSHGARACSWMRTVVGGLG